ncbi:MAG: protein kinase [Myxococcales bacterium]|nr:protein kinase [Myxococcales bacterium]
MSEPLESEAGEDPGSAVNSAIKRTRLGYAPSLVGPRASLLTPVPRPEESRAAAVTVPEIAAAAAATATGPHQTIVASRLGGVLPARDAKAANSERTRLRLVTGKLIPGTRYRLVRWLGEGGMGVVYEAEHIDIERHVALKVLRFDLSQQPEMAQVFRDEARAASRMGHPNVVEIFDFGELPDGRLFICMEMLAGHDLVPADVKSLPDHGSLVATLRQLCKGLAAAHAHGIVHRDIKPENIILVERGGRSGVVKLVDFGISAMLAAGPPQSSRIAGTPHYMAPEQIEGKPFDGRLDMYAVGCVAYELMTGAAPFPGEVVEEVLLAQLDDEPTPPSKLVPERKILPALEAVVLRCLAKQPERRYADMHDLEAALCEAQIASGLRTAWDDLPLPPVEPERLARLRRGMPGGLEPRRRWLLPAIGLASLAAGVALTWALLPGEPGARARGEIDRIAEEALAAASLTHYVAPPASEPEAPTAYKKVLELEAVDGDAAALADDRAAELRRRFASGLVSLGDKYWDVAGARPFAVEYYIWARSFDPDNARAIERSGLTDGRFAVFEDKAASGGWSLGELQALGLVGAFADEDRERRGHALERALADSDQLSLRDRLIIKDSLVAVGALPRRPEKASIPAATTTAPAPTPAEALRPEVAASAPAPVPADMPTMTGPDAPAPTFTAPVEPPHRRPKLAPVKRDPTRARALAEEGVAALRNGRRGEAESLFHQAIAYDNRNVKALMGLSDVYFDTGVKQKAVKFAELAVEAAPQSKACHLKLGDAYYTVLRYRDALEHYEKARDLGEASAGGRIDKVKARLGG